MSHNAGVTLALAAIHVYPVKSCAALSPATATVEARGLAGDRRWMIVDIDAKFITARQQPRLTLVRAVPIDGGLQLDAPGMPTLVLREPRGGDRLRAMVWRSVVQALPTDAEADAWISAWLGLPARFVFMDAACKRAVSRQYGKPGDVVSFADGYPLLLISQASLDGLNARLAEPLPMLRFRPNLVVTARAPHAEDTWKRVRIGGVDFDLVKACTRCVLTTVNVERGTFDPAGEPLRTLRTYRRTRGGITFGQNLIPRSRGTLAVGDAVEVLD
jgi:uncharacterized protein YcbX